MNHQQVIQEAIANIASTSQAIEKYCNDPNSTCSPYAASLLERMSWELHKQAEELEEINYLYVS
jgi:hypothetical protein